MPCHIPEVAYGEEEEPIVLNSTVEKKKKNNQEGKSETLWRNPNKISIKCWEKKKNLL